MELAESTAQHPNAVTMPCSNETTLAIRSYAAGGARARWLSEMSVSETRVSGRLRVWDVSRTEAIGARTQATTKAVAATVHMAQVSGLCSPEPPSASQWSRCRLWNAGTIRTPTTKSTTPKNAKSLFILSGTLAFQLSYYKGFGTCTGFSSVAVDITESHSGGPRQSSC